MTRVIHSSFCLPDPNRIAQIGDSNQFGNVFCHLLMQPDPRQGSYPTEGAVPILLEMASLLSLILALILSLLSFLGILFLDALEFVTGLPKKAMRKS
jgi:hypothetical protein